MTAPAPDGGAPLWAAAGPPAKAKDRASERARAALLFRLYIAIGRGGTG